VALAGEGHILFSIHNESYGFPGHPGGDGHGCTHDFRVVFLASECAAHGVGDGPDFVRVQSEDMGNSVNDIVGTLHGSPDTDGVSVPPCDEGLALHVELFLKAGVIHAFNHTVRPGEGGIHITAIQIDPAEDVVITVNGSAAELQSGVDVRADRQRLNVHLDFIYQTIGHLGIGTDDTGRNLADVAYFIRGETGPIPTGGQGKNILAGNIFGGDDTITLGSLGKAQGFDSSPGMGRPIESSDKHFRRESRVGSQGNPAVRTSRIITAAGPLTEFQIRGVEGTAGGFGHTVGPGNGPGDVVVTSSHNSTPFMAVVMSFRPLPVTNTTALSVLPGPLPASRSANSPA
jgi:hypothetical protein